MGFESAESESIDSQDSDSGPCLVQSEDKVSANRTVMLSKMVTKTQCTNSVMSTAQKEHILDS